jgi:hypothetical protein
MDAEIRKKEARGNTSEAITEAAIKNGMKTLKDYSLWLMENGWTSMDEVLQVVSVQAAFSGSQFDVEAALRRQVASGTRRYDKHPDRLLLSEIP